MRPDKHWRWWTVALRGVAAIALGIIMLFAPQAAYVSIVLCFGIYALVDGLLVLGLAGKGSLHPRGMMMLRGLVSIAAGVAVLAMPGLASLAVILIIAGWAIVSGFVEIAMAVELHRRIRHEWLLAIEGVVSIGFGIMLAVAPLAGAIVVGIWVGAFALVIGGLLLSSAFRLRSHEHHDAIGAVA
jgi:uncharacterized membrane protein HdeD (DUF308 family)